MANLDCQSGQTKRRQKRLSPRTREQERKVSDKVDQATHPEGWTQQAKNNINMLLPGSDDCRDDISTIMLDAPMLDSTKRSGRAASAQEHLLERKASRHYELDA